LKKINIKSLFYTKKTSKSKVEIIVICLTLFLCVLGCVMVFSASSYSAKKNYGNKFFFFTKQIIGVIVGFVGLVFFYFFDYNKLKKLKWPLFIVSVIMLILVFIPHIGIENYGAKRWINLAGVSFQPSELAKFSLVYFVLVT